MRNLSQKLWLSTGQQIKRRWIGKNVCDYVSQHIDWSKCNDDPSPIYTCLSFFHIKNSSLFTNWAMMCSGRLKIVASMTPSVAFCLQLIFYRRKTVYYSRVWYWGYCSSFMVVVDNIYHQIGTYYYQYSNHDFWFVPEKRLNKHYNANCTLVHRELL